MASALVQSVLYGHAMITTTTRTLLASLALTLAAGCGSVPSDTDTDTDADTEDPAPDAPVLPDLPDAPPVIAAGTPDATFGTGGVKTLALGSGYASSLVAQDDKLLACVTNIEGDHWFLDVVRLDASGVLDETFADAGVLAIDYYGASLGCRSLAVRPDGSFVVGGRKPGSTDGTLSVWDRDGKTHALNMFGSMGYSKASASTSMDEVAAVGRRSGSKLSVQTFRTADDVVSNAPDAVTGDIVRAIQSPSAGRVAVGSFTSAGTTGWGVLRQNVAAPESLDLGASTISSGVGATDLMSDAIELPDGSFFAIGSAGAGEAVMVARFTAIAATEEHHEAGGPSMAYGVALDGAQRPIVVGSAQDAGKSVFGWQRYQAASTTLDTTYRTEGMAKLAPPSGSGELVAAARLGDKIYMLGHYDVETATPKLALVRVTE